MLMEMQQQKAFKLLWRPLVEKTLIISLINGYMAKNTQNISLVGAYFLIQMAKKMLQQASLETRQTLDTAERVNLSAIIHRVVDGFAPKLEKKQLKLHASIPDQAIVHGDPFLLEQALLNLIENAADFSPPGNSLELTLERQDQVWCLRMRDHGPGVPDYALGRVFERYYSLPRPEGGAKSTGLGLTFVRQVMELHKGRVTLDNHPEGGAEARLDIPAMS